jgi:hypothetical protein
MLGHILCLVYPYKIHAEEEELVDRIKCMPFDRQLPKLVRKIDQLYGDIPKYYEHHDFGSSWKPSVQVSSADTLPEPQSQIPSKKIIEPWLKKKIQAEAREYLEDGFSVIEVQSCFPQLSIREVGALKAWVTMRNSGVIPKVGRKSKI